jgi:hypothetical protein
VLHSRVRVWLAKLAKGGAAAARLTVRVVWLAWALRLARRFGASGALLIKLRTTLGRAPWRGS